MSWYGLCDLYTHTYSNCTSVSGTHTSWTIQKTTANAEQQIMMLAVDTDKAQRKLNSQLHIATGSRDSRQCPTVNPSAHTHTQVWSRQASVCSTTCLATEVNANRNREAWTNKLRRASEILTHADRKTLEIVTGIHTHALIFSHIQWLLNKQTET